MFELIDHSDYVLLPIVNLSDALNFKTNEIKEVHL